MKPEVWERIYNETVFLDHTDKRLEIDQEDVERFYEPLAEYFLSQGSERYRTLVAIVGAPGSGKTAFSNSLATVINAISGSSRALVIGLDGWHYPNAYLDTHMVVRNGTDVLLRNIKGAPETFDVYKVWDCLRRIQTEEEVEFPIYSRIAHEPLSGGGCVLASHKLILVEGNYLLLDEEPWRRIQALFNKRVFITARQEILVAALRERHVRGGKTILEANNHIQTADLPNGQRVLANLSGVDFIVTKKDEKRIENLTYCVGE